MNWREQFKKSLDFTYEMVKREVADIKYPCYGGELYKYALLYTNKTFVFI